MKWSLLETLGLSDDLADAGTRLEFVDEEIERSLADGNAVGAGEWFIERGRTTTGEDQLEAVCQAITYWASDRASISPCTSFHEIIERFTEFAPDNLARALLGAAIRLQEIDFSTYPRFDDLEFRLQEALRDMAPKGRVRGPRRRTSATSAKGQLSRLLAQYEADLAAVVTASVALERTSCISAKNAAVGVVRAVNGLRGYLLPAEGQVPIAVDAVLGTNFRKFCEACVRRELNRIAQRHQLVFRQAARTKEDAGAMDDSVIWHAIVRPICDTTTRLAQDGRAMCSVLPNLQLARSEVRLDLSRTDIEHMVSVRLLNTGDGDAKNVTMHVRSTSSRATVRVVDPRRPFDLRANESTLVALGVKLATPTARLSIGLEWRCSTISNADHHDADTLQVGQQTVQPDWDLLESTPPYPANAIKKRDDLFGRDAILQELAMNASRGTSTFLWGQKRVGKTSVVQVLQRELAIRQGYLPILFRMGELGALHEGQMAERIASRIAEELPSVDPPREGEFSVGLGDLIPWVDRLLRRSDDLRPVVIIDEFDDLDRS